MSAINAGNPTLLDMVKRTNPDGAIAQVVEMLSQRIGLLKYLTFQEGNLTGGHRITSRTALPGVGWRTFNKGVAPSKSRVNQFDEACGMLEAWSVVDARLLELNGNDAAWRASEEVPFLNALRNELEYSVFYTSTKTQPERIMGLAPRFDSTTADGGGQIIKHDPASAGNDSASAWLLAMGPKRVYGIFGKGQKGGLKANVMPEQMVDDGAGGKYRAVSTNWEWNVGLAVEDWRSVVRVANIDDTTLSATGMALVQSMVKAYYLLNDPSDARLLWVVNRKVASYLHLQALDSVKNSTLTIERIAGQPITMIMGIPVVISDVLISTEATIS